MKYMKSLKPPLDVWHNPDAAHIDNGDEFDKSFRAVYGKGYVASEPEIRKAMMPRVELIAKLVKGPVRLVDIGTAYGTFLTCLPADWKAIGIEPMKDVANYAGMMLKRNVWCDTVYKYHRVVPFNVATMWNVIEHLDDPIAAIQNISENLVAGGLLCISTPNADGGFFRYRRDLYEARDDKTHQWAFTPKTLSKLLKDNGFDIVKVVITGHHPERWGGSMWRSRLFKLGDTFELYARKRSWI